MAPANRPSTLARVKTRDFVIPEADSFFVTGSTLASVPLATVQRGLKLTTNVGFSEKMPGFVGGQCWVFRKLPGSVGG